MRGDVTDAGQPTKRRTTEDRAIQPMEAGGWLSLAICEKLGQVGSIGNRQQEHERKQK